MVLLLFFAGMIGDPSGEPVNVSPLIEQGKIAEARAAIKVTGIRKIVSPPAPLLHLLLLQ